MSFNAVTISIGVDTTEGNVAVDALQAKIDRQQGEWKQARIQIMNEIREVSRGINMLFQSIRLAVAITGQSIDPVFSALMSIISGTVSLMLATAAALATSVILAGVGVALGAAALGLQLGQTAKLIIERKMVSDRLRNIEARIAKYAAIGSSGGAYL